MHIFKVPFFLAAFVLATASFLHESSDNLAINRKIGFSSSGSFHIRSVLGLRGGSETAHSSFEYVSPQEAASIQTDVLRMWHVSEMESLRDKDTKRIVEVSNDELNASSLEQELAKNGIIHDTPLHNHVQPEINTSLQSALETNISNDVRRDHFVSEQTAPEQNSDTLGAGICETPAVEGYPGLHTKEICAFTVQTSKPEEIQNSSAPSPLTNSAPNVVDKGSTIPAQDPSAAQEPAASQPHVAEEVAEPQPEVKTTPPEQDASDA